MKSFIKRRLIRLYPMHLITLGFRVIPFLIIPLMLGEDVLKKFVALILNLFMLQAWIPDIELIFSYNTIAWFLSPMVFFYLMFPLIYKVVNQVNLQYFLPLLIILYASAVLCVPREYYQEIIYVSPLFRMVDFMVGILCYKLLMFMLERDIRTSLIGVVRGRVPYLVEACVALIILLTIFVHNVCDERLRMAALFWLPMAITILLLSMSEIQIGGAFCRNHYL